MLPLSRSSRLPSPSTSHWASRDVVMGVCQAALSRVLPGYDRDCEFWDRHAIIVAENPCVQNSNRLVVRLTFRMGVRPMCRNLGAVAWRWVRLTCTPGQVQQAMNTGCMWVGYATVPHGDGAPESHGLSHGAPDQT